jgi:hypothetical protein
VLGAVGASAWAGIPFGSLAGGVAVSAFGLRPALLAAAAVYGVTTLTPFMFPVWRQMDRRPGTPYPDTAEPSTPKSRAPGSPTPQPPGPAAPAEHDRPERSNLSA